MTPVQIIQPVLVIRINPQGGAAPVAIPVSAPVRLVPQVVGIQGPPGANINSDPGDFTLVFENQLI